MKVNNVAKYKAYWQDEDGMRVIDELRGKPACILTDTGNGFKIKFPSYRSVEQDIFMSLDYSQASFLKQCLNQWKGD